MSTSSQKIIIAKVQAHHGLNGWVKVYSFSETKEKLCDYNYFFILDNGVYLQLDLEESKIDKSLKLKFKNYDSREDVEKFINQDLFISVDQLAKLNNNEFYWKDLIGLEVFLDNEQKVGNVSDIIETGANDVLVITGNKNFLVPYIYGESIKSVNLKEKRIFIDKIYYEQ